MSDLACVVVDGDGSYPGPTVPITSRTSRHGPPVRGPRMHQLEIPPSGSARPHLHEHNEAAICVLEGAPRSRCDR
jgi:quercetin dioxygenase-like cupin family protein